MKYFAKIANNIVATVVALDDSLDGNYLTDTEDGVWIETYIGGNFRNKYASIGDTYDEDKDIFISQSPTDGFVLDSNFNWIPPVPYPSEEGVPPFYEWDIKTDSWVEVDVELE